MALPNTYVCICGQPLLVSEVPLEELKARKTDGARMLDVSLCKAIITLDSASSVCIKRSVGFEMQYRFKCKRCGLIAAYQNTPDSLEYFIMDGAFVNINPRPAAEAHREHDQRKSVAFVKA
eukprot:m.60013 g.60013  ORF g.60013 m.60013 type:complete len:121 (+) comp12265_c0_seq1:82-444(+)